ncbi:MAG: cytochrome c3 family protein [Gemmatimonadota bacterium]|nr:cytochrome c3 family protein [Gemmatimonadota bacterium]
MARTRADFPMPHQVPRLLAVFAVAVIGLVVARGLLVPETFGDRGHYRAAAVDSISAREQRYAGHHECALCHSDVAETRLDGNHRNVSCEVCHEPAARHVAAPMDVKPVVAQNRGLCVLCHAYNPSRPTGFPQIDSVMHNPRVPCMRCHQPHAPETPVPPTSCSACHGQIASQLTVSHHAALPCSTCHEAPDEHRMNPRAVRPTKPTARAFCGTCHAGGLAGIPQIDLRNHGEPYVCWQCHYPHYPEAR